MSDTNNQARLRHSSCERREVFQRYNYNGVDEYAGDNRRDSCQRVDQETHRAAEPSLSVFGQINADGNAKRQTDCRRGQQQQQRSHDGVAYAAAFADRPRIVRKKTQVKRAYTLDRNVDEND